MVSNGYTSKCSGPYWSNPPFLSFWHLGTLALRTERQSARSQKIKKRKLDQYGAECFCRLIFATIRRGVGLKGLNWWQFIRMYSHQITIVVNITGYGIARPNQHGTHRTLHVYHNSRGYSRHTSWQSDSTDWRWHISLYAVIAMKL